jgi:predicted dithiol-disulfide oxidoreductase (DUF899 family)
VQARVRLLAAEKEHTRRGDELAATRRELPWVRVDKRYEFDTSEGTKTLADLFAGRSQPLVYHFMFGPELPGLSAFALDDGVVYHTYSCYARGLDAFNATYQLLDRSPRGRDEGGLPMSAAWVRRHDEHGQAEPVPAR